MILSAQSIKRVQQLVTPLREAYTDQLGNSAGLGACGVDITLDAPVDLSPGEFVLAATVEHFSLPSWIMGVVHDKSSLARRGLAVQNTALEPGWRGYLTLELSVHGGQRIVLPKGSAVAQVIFHWLDEPTISLTKASTKTKSEAFRTIIEGWLREHGRDLAFPVGAVEDLLERIVTSLQAWSSQPSADLQAERLRCARIVCPDCAKGVPLDRGEHVLETVQGHVSWSRACLAQTILQPGAR